MKRTLLCTSFVFVLAASLFADSNLRIADVGLHGYYGAPAAVRLIVLNPSLKPQPFHLQVVVGNQNGVTSTATAVATLSGSEQRQLELPVLIPDGTETITADAIAASGTVVGHDTYRLASRSRWPQTRLIVLMCLTDKICKSAQSQIQLSGTIEERADKNRQTSIETVSDPREDWWAYSGASAVVLAMATEKLEPEQKAAMEGYLRLGGRLVLLEHEIADPGFLSAYRHTPALSTGERVGRGTLYRVAGLDTNTLGDVFAGRNLPEFLSERYDWQGWSQMDQTGVMRRRFSTSFNFPRLRWVLVWLGTYIVVIGVLNFAVLRMLHRMEWGWITVTTVALLFAAGFYISSASRRPKEFRLDNLATYYLDPRSPLAAANYSLRVSAPERREVSVSVADPAVFTFSRFTRGDAHGQIWADMNRQQAEVNRGYDIILGPPRRAELSLLKWSFRDLDLQGLHEFSGTIHFVAPNRLRNDTGQHFSEAVYLDYPSNVLYALPAMAPGAEIKLDAITPRPIRTKAERQYRPPDKEESLQELALRDALPFASAGRMFAGFSDGPVLPVELGVSHHRNTHALIIVAMEQP